MLGMKLNSKQFSMGFVVAALLIPAVSMAGTTSARSLLSNASAIAKRDKKNVLVIFHASWCGWCKKLDAMLDSPEFKSTFDNSYVITHIDVMENGDKKALENDGGTDLMTQLGAPKNSGIPFFAILSPDRTKLGDSVLPKTGNMGYPSEPFEVAGFKALLKKTAVNMKASDISHIEAFLTAQKSG